MVVVEWCPCQFGVRAPRSRQTGQGLGELRRKLCPRCRHHPSLEATLETVTAKEPAEDWETHHLS